MASIRFADGKMKFTADKMAKITQYFELIGNVLSDTQTAKNVLIPLNCSGFPIKKDTFLSLLAMCATLEIDISMLTVCNYLGCIIPVGVPRDQLCTHAIRTGNPKLLQLAHQSGCKLTYAMCEFAIECNQPECLKYLLENVKHVFQSKSLCNRAAMCGSIECLKLAHQYGCQLTDNTRVNALYSDSLECLVYACEAGNSFSLNVYRTVCIRSNCLDYYLKYIMGHK